MATRINFLGGSRGRDRWAGGNANTEVGMARVLLGALLASLFSIWGVTWLSSREVPEGGPFTEAWPSVLRAQLDLIGPAQDDRFAPIVALAEELYWLRRAETAHQRELGSVLRRATRFGAANEDEEGKALSFLIERVTASLGHELDRWQGQMETLSTLEGIEQDAALRILAFAKWQQKGGAFAYAYDFFGQLSRNAPTVTKTATQPVPPTPTPSPTVRQPPRRPPVAPTPLT